MCLVVLCLAVFYILAHLTGASGSGEYLRVIFVVVLAECVATFLCDSLIEFEKC